LKNRQNEPVEQRLIREGQLKEARRRQRQNREDTLAKINSCGGSRGNYWVVDAIYTWF
jgi:hypothetical protein